MIFSREKRLVQRAGRGDAKAFEELVRKYDLKLYNFALNITEGREPLAKDILQEALLKAFLNISKFEHKSSFSSWIWTIVKNEFHNYIRRNEIDRHIVPDVINSLKSVREKEPDHQLIEEEKNRNLRKLIGMLPDNYEEIITLIVLLEMSYEEAAEFLVIPVGSVKSRFSRAKEKLIKMVKENVELFI